MAEWTWVGSIKNTDGHLVQDIHISAPNGGLISLAQDAVLSFSSIVNTSLIPLRLRCSSILDVTTTKPDTAKWFDSLLCHDNASWWQSSQMESPIGILASVTQEHNPSSESPRATDILFFATTLPGSRSPPTPPRSSSSTTKDAEVLHVRAILLSEDLLHPFPTNDPTPPPSPTSIKALPLPSFSTSRRRKTQPDPSTPPPPSKRVAPSPSPISPSKPDPALPERNKSLLTRQTLTSLRLHGLSRSDDEEYKTTFHAVLRALTFAFRRHMAGVELASRSEAVRDTADRIVALLCADPFAEQMEEEGFKVVEEGKLSVKRRTTAREVKEAKVKKGKGREGVRREPGF